MTREQKVFLAASVGLGPTSVLRQHWAQCSSAPSSPQEAPSVPLVLSEGYQRKMQQKDSRAEREGHWQRRMKAWPNSRLVDE